MDDFLYELKSSLVSVNEAEYLTCIKSVMPDNYLLIPQANLATFIRRTDTAKYQNELYRNVDFLITDCDYKPLIIIEINDRSHYDYSRKVRDEKVKNICEEAGIPIIKLWTSYGINPEYIKKRIETSLNNLPVQRIHHFGAVLEENMEEIIPSSTQNSLSEFDQFEQNVDSRFFKKQKRIISPVGLVTGLILSGITDFMLFWPMLLLFVKQSMTQMMQLYNTQYLLLIVNIISTGLGINAVESGNMKKPGIVLVVMSVIGFFLFFVYKVIFYKEFGKL